MALIKVRDVRKVFQVAEKHPGLKGALAGVFFPRRREVTAIAGVSFDIHAGEIVGYLGPNGAGKSTTIKILTGILHPSSGELEILGLSPQRAREEVVRQLGVVFGQRTQLYWDLRLEESFALLKYLYRIEDRTYRESLEWACQRLELRGLLRTPVRQLSLGQRMRGDLAAAILHSPPILFLDEPTIGLDLESKESVRALVREINRERGTTVILTTHDLEDVEQLCRRLIVINHGVIVQDGSLEKLVAKFAPERTLIAHFHRPPRGLEHPLAESSLVEGSRGIVSFDPERISAAELISDLASRYPIKDLVVKGPSIETMIKNIYRERPCERGERSPQESLVEVTV